MKRETDPLEEILDEPEERQHTVDVSVILSLAIIGCYCVFLLVHIFAGPGAYSGSRTPQCNAVSK